MTDDQLRLLYERVLTRPRQPGSSADVTPEEMMMLAEGRGPEAERLRILDRIMQSEDTRRDFELLRAAITASRPERRLLSPAAAAAAGIVIAAGLGIWWLDTRQPSNPMRGDAPGLSLTAPDDSPAISGPLVFAWRRVPEALGYELELVEANGTLAYLATVTDTTWTPPPDLHLTAGVEYRWWVRAKLPDGTTGEAPPRRLVLSP